MATQTRKKSVATKNATKPRTKPLQVWLSKDSPSPFKKPEPTLWQWMGEECDEVKAWANTLDMPKLSARDKREALENALEHLANIEAELYKALGEVDGGAE